MPRELIAGAPDGGGARTTAEERDPYESILAIGSDGNPASAARHRGRFHKIGVVSTSSGPAAAIGNDARNASAAFKPFTTCLGCG